MSVCGHCGLTLAEGAAACGQCGFVVAPARAATAGAKWGTLDIQRAPRSASGVLPATQVRQESAQLTAAEPAAANEGGAPLDLDAPAQRPRAAARPASAPLAGDEPRTGSRPIGAAERSRGASRPLGRPNGADAGSPARAASRPLSGPLAVESGQQPAVVAARAKPGREGQPARAPSAGGPYDAANSRAGAAARAQAAPIALHGARPGGSPQKGQPPSAAGGQGVHTETGMLDIDGRFSDAMPEGPALELASLQPVPVSRAEEPKQRVQPEQEPEDPLEQRKRRVRELARYAPPPLKLLGAVPYFLRISSRRRELQLQVHNLTQQRMRLDLAAEDALCLLGQALSVKRNDSRLGELAAQLRVVSEAAQDIGTRAAAAKRTENVHKQELQVLERELAAAQAKAQPVQAREQVLAQSIAEQKAQIKRREMLVRKADAELKQLKVAADPASLGKIAMIEHERDNNYGEMQSLNVQLHPLEEDLAAVRGTLAGHLRTLEELEQRKQRMLGAIDRDQGRERIASGGSQSAYREALRSLANAALRAGLADLAPAEQRAAEEASQRATVHRESEELMRAAVSCYDPAAYAKGMQLLVGGAVGTFLLFVALIAF